ncbi:MAG: universal stress protein [Thermodesulfobacteriota bacterium]|nr:universal stress protein [Thermodesulfobacteriota bacterium]
MQNSILVSFNDSVSSRAALNFLGRLALCREDCRITLLHIFIRSSASEELMGKKFTEQEPARLMTVLEEAKKKLVEFGFNSKNVEIEMAMGPHATVSEGIIDHCRRQRYDVVVIGRKRMSRAEEFVLGDVSVKLLRVLEGVPILVVKTD